MILKCSVNHKQIEREVPPHRRVIDFLREDLGLTGVKEGCSEGECGACTILLNARAVTSCTMFVGQLQGQEIVTIEGLEADGELERIQQSFIDHGAIQCGFCSPGMILSVKALLLEVDQPSKEEVKRAIEGNLCRCTGYNQIVEAVEALTVKK